MADLTVGLDSPVLSLAIPLTVVSPRGRRRQRENFFRELLPEGAVDETHAAVLEMAASEIPDQRVYAGLVEDIQRFAGNLPAGRAVGGSNASKDATLR